jgi:arylsulfatase A-like enzyme
VGFEVGLAAYQDTTIGAEFPHDLTKSKRAYASAILRSAFADRLLSDLALRLLADDALALGRDDVTDLLGISFSASDYVAHDYGPESAEMLEVLRALDLELGRLLDDLSARFGKGRVVLALSADHGFFPLPEATDRRDPSARARRMTDVKVARQLNDAVDAELKRPPGSPPLIYRFESCSLWLDRAALAADGSVSAKRVLEIVRRELATTWKDDVLETFLVDGAFRERRTDEIARQAWNSRCPGRSGDLFVVPRFGVLVDPYFGKGSTHGSPWEYDTHVPMILWGGGFVPRVLTAPSTPYDLAPTLGSLLGVSLPDATGKPLDLK